MIMMRLYGAPVFLLCLFFFGISESFMPTIAAVAAAAWWVELLYGGGVLSVLWILF